MNNEEKELKTFFRLCGLINDNANNNTFDGLDGLLIERNILLDNNRYELVKKRYQNFEKYIVLPLLHRCI